MQTTVTAVITYPYTAIATVTINTTISTTITYSYAAIPTITIPDNTTITTLPFLSSFSDAYTTISPISSVSTAMPK